MRVLGVELGRDRAAAEHTLALLDADGSIARSETVVSLPGVAAAVSQLVGDEPFLLGANVPVVVPAKAARARTVENLIRRRFGYRLPPGGRSSLTTEPLGVAGEALVAGLATAGLPSLPYPDRDRRQSGLAEIHPGLALKALLWEHGGLADDREQAAREEIFRAYGVPAYRRAALPARAGWAEHAVALEWALRLVGSPDGFDFTPAEQSLRSATSAAEVERAAALFDAALIAGTARRYLESPQGCLFLGDQENGYTILPADAFIRRLASTESAPSRGALFPQASLRERLGNDARVRPMDLLGQQLEATFRNRPEYEFDNRDEMLWWKHCRHLSGPRLPVEGLSELTVTLSGDGQDPNRSLRLVRSRHRILSFRFDPPEAWRAHIPTRDGKTYPMQIQRAVYETLQD